MTAELAALNPMNDPDGKQTAAARKRLHDYLGQALRGQAEPASADANAR